MNNKKKKEMIDISHKNLSRVEFAKEISPLSRTGKRLKKAEHTDNEINESTIKYKPIFTEEVNKKENE